MIQFCTGLPRPGSISDSMFPTPPGMPQTMPRHPFSNTWPTQDHSRPGPWGQPPTYLGQRSTNAHAAPFPFGPGKESYLAGREFMFDPTVRPGVGDRNMFASLSSTRGQAGDANPFPAFDLSTYFGSHPAYSGKYFLNFDDYFEYYC